MPNSQTSPFLGSLVVLSLSVVGCGDKGGKDASTSSASAAPKDEKVASCNQQSIGQCREYRRIIPESLKGLCDPKFVSGSEFKDVPCPTDKLKASCKVTEHKDFYYEGSLISIADHEKDCKRKNGTWEAK